MKNYSKAYVQNILLVSENLVTRTDFTKIYYSCNMKYPSYWCYPDLALNYIVSIAHAKIANLKVEFKQKTLNRSFDRGG